MSETKFTKGPWEKTDKPVVEKLTDEGAIFSCGDWYIYPPLGEAGPVAIVCDEPTANLIETAPDLYKALDEIVRCGILGEACGGSLIERDIDKLLAKARGEST